MCTVSVFPICGKVILTFNRDENIHRLSTLPQIIEQDGMKMVFPKDSIAGGTWIAAAENGTIACLLNGAFEKHQRLGNYIKSRGLVLLDSFKFSNIEKFLEEYNFAGIEPFTMLILQDAIHEIRWNGSQIFHEQIPFDFPRMWSSATLYSEEIRVKRNESLVNFFSHYKDISHDMILNYHKDIGESNYANNMIMSNGNMATVSITSIIRSEKSLEVFYEDLTAKLMHKPVSMDIV